MIVAVNAAMTGTFTGGLYGGGGGTSRNNGAGNNASITSIGGNGGQGVIVLTWTPFVAPVNWGFDQQGDSDLRTPFKMPPRQNRAGAIMRGDDGIEAPIFPFQPSGWESNLPIPLTPFAMTNRNQRLGATMRGDDGIEAPKINFFARGWTPTLPNPLKLTNRNQRLAGAMTEDRDDGNYTPMAPTLPPWFETNLPIPLTPWGFAVRSQKGATMRGDDGTQATLQPFNPVFEVQDAQDNPMNRWKRERSGALARGDDGTELPLPPPAITFVEVQDAQDNPLGRWLRRSQAGALMRGDEGIAAALPFFYPSAETQDAQDNLLTQWWLRRARAGGIMRGIDGTESPFVQFLPVGFDQVLSQDRHPRPERFGALTRGDDGIAARLPPPPISFFDVTATQPLFPKTRTYGALMRGADGIESPLVVFTALEWPWQAMYRHPRPEIAGAVMRGDDGITLPIPPPSPPWFEVTPPFTAHPRPERGGALMRGIDGTDSPFVQFLPFGFPQTFAQEPHIRRERWGVLARGDDGAQLPMPPLFIPWGETTPALTRKALYKSPETGDQGIASPMIVFTALDWPWVQHLAHPRPERSGAIARGDDGITFPMPQVTFPIWETPVPLTLKRFYRSPEFGDQGIAAPFVAFVNPGGAVQPWQPPHTWARHRGAIMRGDDGIEQPLPPVFLPWGETTPALVRKAIYKSPETGDQGIVSPFIAFTALEWPHQQTWYRRPPRSGTIARGDDGNLFPMPPVSFPWFETTSAQIRHPTFRSPEFGDQGIIAPFVAPVVFQTLGWPEPPMHRNPVPRLAGGIMRGDEGIENVFVFVPPPTPLFFGERVSDQLRTQSRALGALRFKMTINAPPAFLPFSFEPTSALTFHRMFHAPEIGDQGIAFPMPVPPAFVPFWEARQEQLRVQPKTMAALRFKMTVNAPPAFLPFTFEPTSALTFHRIFKSPTTGDQGNLGRFLATPLKAWWETPDPQMRHPRPERAGSIARSHDGIDFPFFLPPVIESWPEPPMHKRPTQWRGGAFMRGHEGTDATLIRFLPVGFEAVFTQPPHPRPERSGAVARGDEGIVAKLIPPPPPFVAWPDPPMHPRPLPWRSAAATMRGDEGIQSPLVGFFPHGWPVQPFQPPRLRHERRGNIFRGDEGTQAPQPARFIPFFEPFQHPLFFRRPQPHVPVFLLNPVETYAKFVPTIVAAASTIIVPYRAPTTIGRMELDTIIEAFSATTVIKRQDP
jgi:hypothetical protein